MLFIFYPRVLQKLQSTRSLTRVVLQAPVDKVLTLLRDVRRDVGSLEIGQSLLKSYMSVAFAVETSTPWILT